MRIVIHKAVLIGIVLAPEIVPGVFPMKIINHIIALVLIVSGLFVMFSSSMIGGALSGVFGFPLFVAGLLLALLPLFRGSDGLNG